MIPVLYGSQTGTCAHLANLLKKEMEMTTLVLPVNRFNFKLANKFPLIVFIVSTHGDGQCPFNMANLWDFLSGDALPVFRFRYAVLGVGSSSFERYNWCGKILYERLGKFGGIGILRTLADTKSNNGVYDGFRQFVEELKLKIEEIDSKTPGILNIQTELSSCVVNPDVIAATLVQRELVTAAEYDQKVYEIVLDIPEYTGYLPGDCLGIIPENPNDIVEKLNFSAKDKEYARRHVDLMAPPRQTFFQYLVGATENAAYAEKLRTISTDYELYFEYVVKPKRNVLEILFDFNISPTFEIIKHLEPIYPRYYSCAKVDGTYRILMRDVEYYTSLKRPRKGLCCEYLKNNLNLGDVIMVEVSRSRLFFEDVNLLFFSTGTGITLPRSVIHYFSGKNIKIYQGFRRFGKDQLCLSEFNDVEVYPAASVDNKQHIMDVYRKNPVSNINDWLIFVSGNTRVNKEIRKLLQEVHGEDVPFQSETW